MRSSLPAILPLLLTTFFAIIAHASSHPAAAPAPTVTIASPPPPAWTPLASVNDVTTQQVGQFAVRIYALTKRRQLVFVNVVSGQSQPWNGGYNYQLVITAAGPGGKVSQYDALVWGILGKTSWKLMSFTPK